MCRNPVLEEAVPPSKSSIARDMYIWAASDA
jgi:hypothetical protein